MPQVSVGEPIFHKQSVLYQHYLSILLSFVEWLCHIFSCLIKCFIGVELFALETHSVWVSAEVVQVPRRRFPRPLHPCYDSSVFCQLCFVCDFSNCHYFVPISYPDKIPSLHFHTGFCSKFNYYPSFLPTSASNRTCKGQARVFN